MNWEDARKNCRRDQFELSSVLDPYSHSFLWLKMLKYGVPMWIGLNSNVVRMSNLLNTMLLLLWTNQELKSLIISLYFSVLIYILVLNTFMCCKIYR